MQRAQGRQDVVCGQRGNREIGHDAGGSRPSEGRPHEASHGARTGSGDEARAKHAARNGRHDTEGDVRRENLLGCVKNRGAWWWPRARVGEQQFEDLSLPRFDRVRPHEEGQLHVGGGCEGSG